MSLPWSKMDVKDWKSIVARLEKCPWIKKVPCRAGKYRRHHALPRPPSGSLVSQPDASSSSALLDS